MKLINLHTHRVNNEGDIQILNVFAQELTDAEPESLYSAGLHPWHIGNVNPEKCIEAIEKATNVNEAELGAVAKDGMPNIPGMDLFK